jgi:hypothetical protein
MEFIILSSFGNLLNRSKRLSFYSATVVVSTSKQILKGLSQGGVYYRHDHYCSRNGSDAQPIRITVLNLVCKRNSASCADKPTTACLKRYGFDSLLLSDNLGSTNLLNTQDAAGRAQLDQLINNLIVVPTDVSSSSYLRVIDQLIIPRAAAFIIVST